MLRFRPALGLAALVASPRLSPSSCFGLAVVVLALVTACDGDPAPADGSVPRTDAGEGIAGDLHAERLWQSSDTSCVYTSPLLVHSQETTPCS